MRTQVQTSLVKIIYGNYKKSELHKGILYNNTIVGVISLNRSSQVEYEVVQYSTKLGISIKNYFKLLQKELNCNLLLYIDREIDSSKLYETYECVLIQITNPMYYHTKDFIILKHSNDISEIDDLISQGHYIIWDCGFKIYSFKK